MPVIGKVKKFLRGFAQVVLDLDDTSFPQEQYDVISSLPKKLLPSTSSGELSNQVRFLVKKHLVDSIAVVENDGTIVVSSNGTSLSEGIRASALFNYISSEMPKSQAVMIREGSWCMLYPYKGRIYIVKAQNSLTTIEMKAIAKEFDSFFAEAD